MREIIFRGQKLCPDWHADYKEWQYGYLYEDCYGDYRIATEMGTCNKVFDDTIGQYTGLTDKNGKRIFEGDIVKFEDAVADCEGYHDNVFSNRSVIKYIDGSFTVCGTDVVTMSDLVYKDEFDGEVIGNIHDNPELLEGWQ